MFRWSIWTDRTWSITPDFADSHAQWEIRSYANVIGNEIVRNWCPISWEAFQTYRLNSFNLSEIELIVLKHFIENKPKKAKKYLLTRKMLKIEGNNIKRNREVIEMENKLKKLGITIDWENY